jgi:hypothetical protein
MNILLDFIRGVGLSLEFPGDGIHCAITLLIVRILFVDDKTAEEFDDAA